MTAITLSASFTGCATWCSFQRKNSSAAVSGDRQVQAALLPASQIQRCHPAQLPSRTSRLSNARRSSLICRADGVEGVERLAEGTRVRVTRSIMVYHAPKRKEGLDLKGMEGDLVAHVDIYNGKQLSSNMPMKVQFLIDNDGKESKFFSHLAEDEIEAV